MQEAAAKALDECTGKIEQLVLVDETRVHEDEEDGEGEELVLGCVDNVGQLKRSQQVLEDDVDTCEYEIVIEVEHADGLSKEELQASIIEMLKEQHPRLSHERACEIAAQFVE